MYVSMSENDNFQHVGGDNGPALYRPPADDDNDYPTLGGPEHPTPGDPTVGRRVQPDVDDDDDDDDEKGGRFGKFTSGLSRPRGGGRNKPARVASDGDGDKKGLLVAGGLSVLSLAIGVGLGATFRAPAADEVTAPAPKEVTPVACEEAVALARMNVTASEEADGHARAVAGLLKRGGDSSAAVQQYVAAREKVNWEAFEVAAAACSGEEAPDAEAPAAPDAQEPAAPDAEAPAVPDAPAQPDAPAVPNPDGPATDPNTPTATPAP